jgi:hypothetical protein
VIKIAVLRGVLLLNSISTFKVQRFFQLHP